MEDNFICAICLEVADAAVETSCCHHIFCESCLDRLQDNACPTCRARYTATPSFLARRIIGGLEIECIYNCGIKLTRSEKKSHELTCPKKVFSCSAKACGFEGTRDAFLNHLHTEHPDALLKGSSKLFEDEVPIDASNPYVNNDRIKTLYAAGHPVRLGETGKYYCMQQLDGHCSCCNGYCGPTNGCNCSSCMKKDVDVRVLPRGWLVNRDGAPCRKGTTGKYYCGRRVMTDDRRTDGYCGPTNGNNCRACRIIDKKSTTRYANVWS
ncbi:hypothetical protein SNE40_002658 [Patella caerulea]|uniref:RING-type domain-containing protein n=1 Tax=Patella caerulea TaxID=87958 RepID=A0AAN8K8X2_PATCE